MRQCWLSIHRLTGSSRSGDGRTAALLSWPHSCQSLAAFQPRLAPPSQPRPYTPCPMCRPVTARPTPQRRNRAQTQDRRPRAHRARARCLPCRGGVVWVGRAGPGVFGVPTDRRTTRALLLFAQSRNGFYRADPLNSDATYTVEAAGDASAEHGYNTVRIHDGVAEVAEAGLLPTRSALSTAPSASPASRSSAFPHGLVVEVVADEEDAAELV